MKKEKLLISACLLGKNCKYSGGNNGLSGEVISRLREKYSLVAVCPETAGGLPIPREPSERVGERVLSRSGRDVTLEYRKGAEVTAELAVRFGCKTALMKAKSPSCGSGEIYDGTFSGVLIPGDGTATERLRALGVKVYSEKEIEGLL